MKGWFKLHRQYIDSDFWISEPFTKPQAWVDLIALANHRPGSVWIRGVEIQVKRGQTARSELTLCKRWKWSRKKVRNFLKWLEKEHQIEQQKSNVTSLISIINYDHYQSEDTANGTPEGTTEEHQKNTKGYTNKNDKKNKNEKNIKTIQKKKSPKKTFSPPTQQEVIAYFLENGFSESAGIRAWEYYEAGGWRDSRGNQVRSWKQKMRGVWFGDGNREGANNGKRSGFKASQNFTGQDDREPILPVRTPIYE